MVTVTLKFPPSEAVPRLGPVGESQRRVTGSELKSRPVTVTWLRAAPELGLTLMLAFGKHAQASAAVPTKTANPPRSISGMRRARRFKTALSVGNRE